MTPPCLFRRRLYIIAGFVVCVAKSAGFVVCVAQCYVGFEAMCVW